MLKNNIKKLPEDSTKMYHKKLKKPYINQPY